MSIRVILVLAVLSASGVTAAEAQLRPSARVPQFIELSGGYGFHFGGGASVREGRLDIDESGSFGFTLDIPVQQNARVELFYWRQNSQVEFQPFVGTPSATDVGVEYYQVGGMTEFPQGNLAPYGLLTLGTTRLIAKGNLSGDEWRFSGTLGAGLKIAPQGRVGVKFEARLLLTANNTGSSFWCGTGGCAVGVVGNPIAQGLLSANVYVKLGGPR